MTKNNSLAGLSRDQIKRAFNFAVADNKDFLIVVRPQNGGDAQTRGINNALAERQLLALLRRCDDMDIVVVYPLKRIFEMTRPGDESLLPQQALENARRIFAAEKAQRFSAI